MHGQAEAPLPMPRHLTPAAVLDECDTLMFDMDGTLLDLAFDNYMWLQHIPAAYARQNGLRDDEARSRLYAHYRRLQGQLEWYCLDHWSERLGIDVLALHRAEHQRIGWLPGARSFLAAQAGQGRRLLLVTNSHPDTLRVKDEVTGIGAFFDRIYSAHDFGHAKEQQSFWRKLAAVEPFARERTLFVDDTEPVLASAQRFGIGNLLAVTRPDTSQPTRRGGRFAGIAGVAELLRAADGD